MLRNLSFCITFDLFVSGYYLLYKETNLDLAMTITAYDLLKMYKEANRDMFRSPIFNQNKEVMQILSNPSRSIFKVNQALDELKKLSKNEEGARELSKIAMDQAIIIGFIEKQANEYYEKNGTSKSYFDYFKHLCKDEDVLEFNLVELIKENNDDFIILKECLYGILLTSATGANYKEEDAVVQLEKLLQPKKTEIKKEILADEKEVSNEFKANKQSRSQP